MFLFLLWLMHSNSANYISKDYSIEITIEGVNLVIPIPGLPV